MSTELPIIQAQTFTPIYSQSEDRIRLIVNYADYANRADLWLTRSFLLKLIPVIEDTLDKYEPQEQEPQVQIQTDQKAQTPTDTSTLAVTEKAGELVRTVDITYRPASKQYELVFKTDRFHAVSVLNGPLLRTILKAIFTAIPKIDWGISPQWIR